MKKRVLVILSMSLLLAASMVTFIKKSEMAIFETNVEVLARSEGGGFGPMCSKTGNPGSYNMKLCSECVSNGKYAMDVVAFCQN